MRLYRLLVLWLAIFVFGSGAARAQNLLQNSDFHEGLKGWTLRQNNSAQAESVDAEVPGAGEGLKQALRLEITPNEGDAPQSVALSQPVESAVRIHDRVTLKFWARADEATKIEAVFRQSAPPQTPRITRIFDLGATWKEFEMSGVLWQPLEARTHELVFHLGLEPTAIELTGVRLTIAPGKTPEESESGPPQSAETPALMRADFSRGLENWNLPETWNTLPDATRAAMSLVPLKDSAFSQALRFVVTPRSKDTIDRVWLRRRLPVAVKRGDRLTVKVWARSREAAPLNIVMENRRDPKGPKLAQKKVALTGDWQQLEAGGIASKDYEAGQLALVFEFGAAAATIDFAGVEVVKAP